MALSFPNSPTNGQIYTDGSSGNRWSWDAANTAWKSTSTFTQTITVASTAPGTPVVGQLWWNQDYGRLLVYYSDGTSSQWVDASPSDATSALAYGQANTVFGVANAAFGKANTALQNTSGVVFAGNLNITGNVGIATTTPGAPISFGNLDGAKVYLRNNTNEYAIGVETNELRIASYSATTFYSGGYSGTERMRIDSSGNFMMGRTTATATMHLNSAINQNMLQLYNSVAGSGTPSILIQKASNDATTAQVLMQFLYNSGTLGLGQINGNGGSQAAFGSYSDIRLKENVENLSDQLNNIRSLRPVEFDYIEGTGYSGHQIGFIAQEMQEVYSDAVAEGSDGMLTITGWNKTEARLVKALQEACQKIDSLEARITELEKK